jgi:hypothetical protein
MGLPVVCSDAGGLPENVDHGVTGFVVGRRDSEAMADQLAALAADAELRAGMGQSARSRAETVLNVDRQLDRFEDIYEELLDAPRQEQVKPLAEARVSSRGQRTAGLRSQLEELEARKQELTLELWRREVLDAVQAFVRVSLPRRANVLIVSRGDEEIVDFVDQDGGHFPQSEDGRYAGYHPADSQEAIQHLEELRARGAQYLIFPATSGWWLEHYRELTRHLDSEHRRLEESNEHFVAFKLTAGGGPSELAGGEPAKDPVVSR